MSMTPAWSRYKAGEPLSVLDGVPFAVKDLMDALPCPTGAGTSYLASRCARASPMTNTPQFLPPYSINCRPLLAAILRC